MIDAVLDRIGSAVGVDPAIEPGHRDRVEFLRGLFPGGCVLVKMPHPFVDTMLDVLLALRLVDGMGDLLVAVDERVVLDVREPERGCLLDDGLRFAS